MASNFSANQYEQAFSAKNLCNWQVPHWYPKYPIRRTINTEFIANENGHLLPHIKRPNSSPWGHFKGTWELPDIITRQHAYALSAPKIGGSRWEIPSSKKNRHLTIKLEPDVLVKKEKDDVRKNLEELVKTEHTNEKEKIKETPKKTFNEKEKLNNPIAISQKGKRSIRHETLERDNDLH